ncbi:histidine phosphatase family protein [Paenibacillus sp. GCM10027626]|uniref:histidine phosphatase family protein n=1 Tax=Paenibacillus sp. GCM10027626 TaxID=3273411 RepID=UPI00363100FF
MHMVRKIGLVRHFKVKHPYPKGRRFSADEVTEWFRAYDQADIEEGETGLGETAWDECYVSVMPRAVRTAELIFGGKLHVKAELREIPAPEFKFKLKLPFLVWAILIRFSGLFNRRTRADIEEAKARVKTVIDEIMVGQASSVLIVSHAALMHYLRKELKRRGFHGPGFTYADNGKLYLYERDEKNFYRSPSRMSDL